MVKEGWVEGTDSGDLWTGGAKQSRAVVTVQWQRSRQAQKQKSDVSD
jgi:hypothetical protein